MKFVVEYTNIINDQLIIFSNLLKIKDITNFYFEYVGLFLADHDLSINLYKITINLFGIPITYFHNYLTRVWEKPFLVVDSYGKIYKPSNTKTLTSVPRRIFIINVMYLPKGIYFASPFADERLEPEDIEKSWDISSSFLILSWDIHR